MINEKKILFLLLVIIIGLLLYQTNFNYQALVGPTVIETDQGGISFLTIDATNRVSYINRKSGVFCSEPPPDALADSDTKSSLRSAAKGGKTLDAEMDIEKLMFQSTKSLFARSQAIQMFRDGMFYLCQMYANDAISRQEYVARHRKLLDNVYLLLNSEIQLRGGAANKAN
jgi:hypothetical protein